jgi:hypothetical protein
MPPPAVIMAGDPQVPQVTSSKASSVGDRAATVSATIDEVPDTLETRPMDEIGSFTLQNTSVSETTNSERASDIIATFSDVLNADLVLDNDYFLPDDSFFDIYLNGNAAVRNNSLDHNSPDGQYSLTEFDSQLLQSRTFCSPYPSWLSDWNFAHLTDEQFSLLAKAKAFTLPAQKTIEKLIKLYFIYFHPSWPILNERHLHNIITSNGNTSERSNSTTVSLSLLNSIMFIASSVSAAARSW